MSTVLDAVRARDGHATSGPTRPQAGGGLQFRSIVLWPSVGLGLAGVAALAALRATWPVEVAESPPPPPVASSREPATPAARTAPPLPTGEAPRARVGPWASPPPASRTPAAPPVPPVAPPPAAPVAVAAPTPAPAPGTRAVHLESIRYGAGPGERTATLAIDGAPPVTLRQGESAGDVEVQLVMPQAVYVRRGADVFALGTVR